MAYIVGGLKVFASKTVAMEYADALYKRTGVIASVEEVTPTPETVPCLNGDCPGTATWSRYCAAHVCDDCGAHKRMDRCFCGWARSGGDGRAELLGMGETIDPEDYY